MNNDKERILPTDLILASVRPTVPGDLAVRIEGLSESEELRRRIAERLGRPRRPSEFSARQMRRRARDNHNIQVGITGLTTDPNHQAELEHDLRELLPKQRSAAVPLCICAGSVHGDLINNPMPYPWWDTAGNFALPPSGNPLWQIAVSLDNRGWNWAMLALSDGASASPPVPKNQVLVGLASGTSWAKEIWVQNYCSGRIGSVFQSGTNAIPNRIMLDSPACFSGADTIVFRKPGFLGIWHDVGYFGTTEFWPAFGGTVADFTWIID